MGTPYIIPLSPDPSQSLTVPLGDQSVRLDIFQKSTGMFMDVYLLELPIAYGIPCLNGAPALADGQYGFSGYLVFFDRVGNDDPTYEMLGDRFALAWIAP